MDSHKVTTALLVLLFCVAVPVHCGIYKTMAEAMLHYMMGGGHHGGGWSDGWESKGVTLGLKSKGMTAIIPIPLPVPLFTKDKGGGGGKVKYVPVPVPSHGGGHKEDWW